MMTSEGEKSALETMARSIPGAAGTKSHLVIDWSIPYHYGMV